MKRVVIAALAALMLLWGAMALAVDYRIEDGNRQSFGELLIELAVAYEAPSDNDIAVIEADLDEIRDSSESDYEVARSIADHWRAVYLDSGYRLHMHRPGEKTASELEQSELRDSATHALVVLGYKLSNGEMTEELKGRCDAAAAAARSYPSANIFCSGGATGDNNPQMHTEAGMMKAYLVDVCGIDPARIHIDEDAMSTLENAENTFALMRECGMRTMTIVTSSYHQRWAQAVYNVVGALYRQSEGYSVDIVENYCFETEPPTDTYRMDDRVAIRQMASLLGLSKEDMSRMQETFEDLMSRR